MSDVATQIPAGWYPDPSGERQWRVWNGSQWSHLTRPYGEPPAATPTKRFGLEELATLDSLRRITQFGVLAYYTGFALLISVVGHWPGRAHPVSERFASAALGAAIGLTLIGTIYFAMCVRALRGRWSLEGLIPVVNTFVAAREMSRRLAMAGAGPRIVLDILLTLGFVALCPTQPWVGVALASVAFNQLARAYALIDLLSGPALRTA
ncbi:MAG: DUF2510 domain-containing protein [Acidobacteriota bacterium]|nr:DUF2510 domain-containing protein [Acidobacteriota bacterium]MDE3093708.1 DUF2510 domain-containing protein [Acidobacteriota bacterium]MDE3146036.1 DUF2510 domain-containing protein [Acidobacteriota bacterium]